MIKRIVFLLFRIEGIISIETIPDVKIAIIRWRVRKTKDNHFVGNIDLSNVAKTLPEGWQMFLMQEYW